MAKWHASKPQKPPVEKFLYLQCDCEDVAYRSHKMMEPEDFMHRLEKSRYVRVAKHDDLATVAEKKCDSRYRVWRNDLGALNFLTITESKKGQSIGSVMATIDGGLQTEWVCKHAVSVARWLARKMWRAEHVFVCWQGDPEIEEKIRWAKHLAGGDWEKPRWMWLNNQICIIGWGFDSPNHVGSNLFGQKHET